MTLKDAVPWCSHPFKDPPTLYQGCSVSPIAQDRSDGVSLIVQVIKDIDLCLVFSWITHSWKPTATLTSVEPRVPLGGTEEVKSPATARAVILEADFLARVKLSDGGNLG